MDMPTYHVIGDEITQTTVLAPGGSGIRDVFQVPYRIDSGPATGHMGTVSVPADVFSREAVQAAIEGQVADVHNVAGLRGPGA